MKRKHRSLSEVQVDPFACPRLPLFNGGGEGKVFTVRLPQGVTIHVPGGFDADELFSLLVVIEEALA